MTLPPDRECTLAEYRAYIVGHDGHYTGCEPIVCPDDPEAINQATRLVDGHAVELWSGDRFVIRLAPAAWDGHEAE
jgi:hypothetical protein